MRILQRFISIIKHCDLDNSDINSILHQFINTIIPAFKKAFYDQHINRDSLLENCFGATESNDSGFNSLVQELRRNSDEVSCHLLAELIKQCIADTMFLDMLKNNQQEAGKITDSMRKLALKCCNECNKNRDKTCEGVARRILRSWMYDQRKKLNKQSIIHQRLSEIIIAMQNEDRQYYEHNDRVELGTKAQFIDNDNKTFNGIVKNVNHSNALFETNLVDADTIHEKDGYLQFEIQGVSFRKKISTKTRYENIHSLSKKHKRAIMTLIFTEHATDQELEALRQHD